MISLGRRSQVLLFALTSTLTLIGGCSNKDGGSNHTAAGGNGGDGGTSGIDLGGGGAGGTAGTDGGAGKTNVGPACGDGLLNQTDERCDDKNRIGGDGCSSECRVEANYLCTTPGKPCITTEVCGDGKLVGDEACDDGNQDDNDGCNATCKLEDGYRCPLPGVPCVEVCGDSRVRGRESCDDGDAESGDGCSNVCVVESGTVQGTNGRPSFWVCNTPGSACTRGVCGDGKKEGAEPCDDGNDRPADGCSPDCELEPQCTAAGCSSQCGDGIILPGEAEACDDGNRRDKDGCSTTCKIEPGYECPQVTAALPTQLMIPVVYRDFVGAQRAKASAPTHPDFESTRGGTNGTPGLVKATLSTTGVPTLTGLCVGAPVNGLLTSTTNSTCPKGQIYGSTTNYFFNQMSSDADFDKWFKDVPAVNRTIVSRLCLSRKDASNTYTFDSKTDNPADCGAVTTCAEGDCWFLPINGKGFVAEGLEIDNLTTPDVFFGSADPSTLKGNFSFTSVVHTWFIFNGGEQLKFSGDDDVWVFINGRLAVDIGGLHGIVAGEVTLDTTQAQKLGLSSGHVYEMVLFHAERYGYGSNFKLTLSGFAKTTSQCSSVCGDAIRAGSEACDNGTNNAPADATDTYGRCTSQCTLGPRCGDAIVQSAAGEECDDPSAQTMYTDTPGEGCTPGCKHAGYCGDGVLQTGYEACDDGDKNSAKSDDYGKCTKTCTLGTYCGDGEKNGDEECDNGKDNGDGNCSIGCRLPVIQ